MSKDSPAPPDYKGAAEASAQSSRDVTEQQTFANRPNVNTPWSQQTWQNTPVWDPTTGQYLNQWTQNTNLTPKAQHALDSQLDVQSGVSDTAKGLLGRNNQLINAPLNWDNFTQMGKTPTPGDYKGPQLDGKIDSSNKYYNDAGKAIFDQYSNRASVANERQDNQLRTRLYNSGLKEGDAAFDSEMQKQHLQQSDAMTDASLRATAGAGAEASRMQGIDVTAKGFGNTAAQQMFGNTLTAGGQKFGEQLQAGNYQSTQRQQQIAEDLQKRGFTLNQINALLNGQQVQTGPTPSFSQATKGTGADYSGAAQGAYSAAMNEANINNANTTGTIGAIGTVAAIAY